MTNLKLRAIASKATLSKKDEEYLLKLYHAGKLSSSDIIEMVYHPTKNILLTLYNEAKTNTEKTSIVCRTPLNVIHDIDNTDYLTTLIRENYEAFNKINFQKFRTKERIFDYARILVAYECSLSSQIYYIKSSFVKPYSEEDQETLDMCETAIFEMRDTFDTANLLLSGKIDPENIDLGKSEASESGEEPNC